MPIFPCACPDHCILYTDINKSLKTAAAALESAIDPQLRAVRDELTPLVSPIHDLAEALRRAFEENAPPGAGHV